MIPPCGTRYCQAGSVSFLFLSASLWVVSLLSIVNLAPRFRAAFVHVTAPGIDVSYPAGLFRLAIRLLVSQAIMHPSITHSRSWLFRASILCAVIRLHPAPAHGRRGLATFGRIFRSMPGMFALFGFSLTFLGYPLDALVVGIIVDPSFYCSI